MRHSTVAVMVAMALGVTAGCGDSPVAADGSDPGLVGRTFLSEAVTRDGAPVDLVEGTRVSLRFTDDGQLLANAGCNHLSAEVSIGTDRLETTALGGTDMGCDPALHDQDQWLAEFLGSTPAWTLDGDRLTLTAGTTEVLLLDRRVADPDLPLMGTRWIVDSIITGETSSSMVAGTEGTAWLVIDGDTFTASSGCRDIEGQVSVGDDHLQFSGAVQTDPACPPELADVDEVFSTILTGRVDFTIEASQLHLDHADGVGLGLHAED